MTFFNVLIYIYKSKLINVVNKNIHFLFNNNVNNLCDVIIDKIK